MLEAMTPRTGERPMEEPNLMPTLAEAEVAVPLQVVPPELDEASPIEKLKRADEARPGFPGEHWLVLALGIALWHFTRRDRHALVRTAGAFGASLLVARAASGREGLSKVLRYTPLGTRIVRVCPPCEQREDATPVIPAKAGIQDVR
jgi:hypothetical protein